jgi:SAM-dependent methyltransferase
MDDGSFVKRVYDRAADRFIFCDEALTWHNRLLTEGASPASRLSLPDLSCLVPASLASSHLGPDLSYLGGHQQMTNMDERTLDYLSERYYIQGMLDVGCGPGGMVEAALQRGISAIGIDGDPAMAERNPFVFVHDYTVRPLHWTPVDLLWCVEFVEHVEEVYVANFLETFRSARILFLTHAVPGQGGYHHVNEQEAKYWQDLIHGLGFSLENEATSWVRNHANNMYTRATGMVFINTGRPDMRFNGPKRPRI